jgi:hypothetical protein
MPMSRRYYSFPWLVAFSEAETIRSIAYKIFKELIDLLKDVLLASTNTNYVRILSMEDPKNAFEECFFKDDIEPPYILYVVY